MASITPVMGSTLIPNIRKPAATARSIVPATTFVARSMRQLPLGIFQPFLILCQYAP